MSLNIKTITSASDITRSIANHTESIILDQLNDFISRGLITIESIGPTFVQDLNTSKVNIQYSCRLVLKDKEYIEKLEKENREFKELLSNLNKFAYLGEIDD